MPTFFVLGLRQRQEKSAAVDRIDRIRAIVERVASSRGLDVFDVQFRRESIGWVLRIYLDRPAPVASTPSAEEGVPTGSSPVLEESVTIEDCQRVSEEVGTILDVEDPINHPYTLEVSSPGLDRPLRHVGDYRRFTGRLAKLVLSEPLDGQTSLTGRLRGVEGDTVVLTDRQGRVRGVPFASIARGRLEVEF